MHLDLNLLLALDALLEEGSVGGAARRMHVTSPAMSRTLGRIRDLTGDEILVRTGREMRPTPYALAVRDEVHGIVLRAQAVLAQRDALDLSRLERIFTLQCHDAIASALGAPLLARMRREAPRVTLRLLAEAPADTSDLRQGNVDLELGATTPSHRDVRHQVLGQDRLVVALRTRHPLAGRKLTARAYADAEHVTVSRRGRLRDPVDDALAAQGLSRRVAAAVPTSAAALRFVSESDLLVAVPETICSTALQALRLKTLPLPVGVPALPIVAAWHRRHEPDRAHVWLRQQVRAVLMELLATRD
jgi:DNA-binding transcriptional LysR family regulator